MLFGLTRGEIALVAFVFALVYGAGLLPKLARAMSGGKARGAGDDRPADPNSD